MNTLAAFKTHFSAHSLRQSEVPVPTARAHFGEQPAHDIAFELCADGHFRFASPSHLDLLGITPLQLVGENARRWVHPDDWVLLGKPRVQLSLRLRHRDGQFRHFKGTSTAQKGGLLFVGHEVSSRKRLENELDALLAIAREINASADFGHLLRQTATLLRPFIAFDHLRITLLEGQTPKQQTLSSLTSDSPQAPEFPTLIRSQCPNHFLWPVLDSETVWSDGDFTNGSTLEMPRAFIVAPLIIEGRPLGLLHFESSTPRDWNLDQLQLASFVAEQFAGVMHAVRLMREQQNHKAEQAQSNALLHATLEAAAEGICLVDDFGQLSSYNRRFATLWNITEANETLLTQEGQVMCHVLSQMADPDEFLVKLGELFEARDASARDEIPLNDGRVFERYSAPVRATDGRSFGRIWTFSDITQRKQQERKLAHQAFHDGLTGLPNRILFTQHLDHSLAKISRTRGAVAVLFLDLDRFKPINDSLGHERGDQLLVEVAARLLNSLRPGDVAARFGGDEFVVLLDQVSSPADATAVADRIASNLWLPFSLDGNEVTVTASIGIVLSTQASDSASDLLRRADVAMYQAKNSGKAHCEIFAEKLPPRETVEKE